VQTDWSVDLFLAAGSSATDQGQMVEAEAKILASRPLWPRGLNISAMSCWVAESERLSAVSNGPSSTHLLSIVQSR